MSAVRKNLGLNRTVVALSIARMAGGIGNSIMFILIPLWIADLPPSAMVMPLPLMVGIAISAFGLSVALLQPVIAAFSDRWGHYKRTVEIGLFILSAATVTFVFAGSYFHLLGLRLLQGAGLALEVPSSMALMSLVTRRETRGGAMGVFTTLRMLGLAAGPVLGGFLHTHFSFNTAFFTAAGVLFVSLAIVWFGVEADEGKRVRTPRGSKKPPLFDLSLYTPELFSAAAATAVMATAFTLVTTLQNEFNQRMGTSAFGFSLGFSTLMVGRLIFQTPLGRFSDRLGRKPFVFYGLLLLAPVTALLGEVSTLVEFATLRFLQGVASAAIVAPALAYAGDIVQAGSGDGAGRQTSVVTSGFGFGIALGPLVAGALATAFFELPFWVDGALAVVAALLVRRYMVETVERQ